MSDDSSFKRALELFNGSAADSPPAPRAAITPEMVALFRRGIAIQREGLTEKWESEGGRRRQYLDVCIALHRLLGRKVWSDDIIADHPVSDEAGRAAREALEAALPRLVSR
jgi:hypothetical protein